MSVPKKSRQLTLLEKVSIASLAFGAVGSLASQKLVYAFVPLPFSFGINQIVERRSRRENQQQTSQTVFLETVREEIASLSNIVNNLQQQQVTQKTAVTQLQNFVHREIGDLNDLNKSFEQKTQQQQQLLTELTKQIEGLNQQQTTQTSRVTQLQGFVTREIGDLKKSYESTTTISIQLQDKLKTSLNKVEEQEYVISELQTQLNQNREWETLLVEDNQNLSQQIKQLENQLCELQQYIQSWYQAPRNTPEQESDCHSQIDLSSIKLGIVGGHPKARNRIFEILRGQYNLKNCVQIPPGSEQHIDYQQIRDKLRNCNLILLITGYIDHALAKLVKKLQNSPDFRGRVLPINANGTTGIIQEIIPAYLRLP